MTSRSSSVSLPHFSLTLPFTCFQLPSTLFQSMRPHSFDGQQVQLHQRRIVPDAMRGRRDGGKRSVPSSKPSDRPFIDSLPRPAIRVVLLSARLRRTVTRGGSLLFGVRLATRDHLASGNLDEFSCIKQENTPYNFQLDGVRRSYMGIVRFPDTEKLTLNIGYVDLGKIDLLVSEGF